MSSIGFGLLFFAIGIYFVASNKELAAKQIKFQMLIGGPYFGATNVLSNRFGFVLCGSGVAILGVLIFFRWVPPPL